MSDYPVRKSTSSISSENAQITSQSVRRDNPRVENQDSLGEFRQKVTITVSIFVMVLLVLFLLISAANVIPLVFISILIAVFLRSLANPLAGFLPIPERWCVILVALGLVASISGFFLVAGPSITTQFDQLVDRVPQALDQVETRLHQYDWGVTLLDGLQSVPLNGTNVNMFSRLTGWFSSAFGAFANIVLVVVAGIYMAFEPDLYIDNLVRLFPIKRRDRAAEILEQLFDILRRWLVARVSSMFVVGILTLIGLIIVGMPLALTLSVIAGLLSFIPTLGPILASVPAILVGLTQSPIMGLLAAFVYFIVQQLENYVITPNIQRHTVSLPPALVMLTQIFLTLLFGWLGLFIAAPMVAAGIVVVKSVYVEDILGDSVGPVVGES